ncbi:Putative glucosylceramidase 2 [Caenorhabditis elegans]|uniref:Putative glucosylceramidase 2 n=1 Tax=Caenorhabditis elegans TaxID=6239 RepID=GLCM2_CAEEL|nr:Putative glucosylceramidase 2 [Caenorhabditis elegans]O16581.2 RecName: Full=Putative glucosylceramidase 2; Flags: Precursor [Caenorhabditis elegans]CCD66456.1 Putative glucosylceramidase 2 [Caenorhabditis elegans]|eukprot:NP_494208.2 Putative glucosylceramidase 2 [Caenorhabditis elegans]
MSIAWSCFVLGLFALASLQVALANDCAQKTFKTGIVCVCNITYCDEIPDINLLSGQAATFTTSKSGARLHRDVVYATNSDPLTSMHFTIDSSKTYQTIQGFGSTFSDASGANLKSLPDQMADTILRQYFSDSGLNLQFGRVPIASNDFSSRVYTYDDNLEDYNMAHFSLQREDYQWKIPYMQMAQKYNHDLKFFAVPWSAPGWLKTTNSTKGYGILLGTNQDTYHKSYVTYILHFLEEYQKNGILFWGLSTQNEPTSGSDKKTKMQSMGFTAEFQRDFIKLDIGPALKSSNAGKNVKILILDDNRGNLPKWADTVLNDKDAASYVSGIAVHSYQDDESDKHLTQTHNNHPDVFIFGTEASEGSKSKDVDYGSFDRAEDYVSDILDDFNNWVTGWTERNLVLDAQGGPSWVSGFADAPVIAFPALAQFYKQPMFYAIAHFSHFLKPGAVRIDHSLNMPNPEIERSAFLNPDGSKVVVLHNKNPLAPYSLSIKDTMKSTDHYQVHLSPKTIVTLYIQN